MYTILETLRAHYLPERKKQVDSDFLQYEEEMSTGQDKERILALLSGTEPLNDKLPNPHNSILLYLTGLSDEFNHQKRRSDLRGGAPPDADLDFDPEGKDHLVELLVERWGREHVAHIAAFGTFKPRSLADDWYRVTERPREEFEQLHKLIPPPQFGKESTLQEIEAEIPKIQEFQDWLQDARRLESAVSHMGIHAAGIVLSSFPIADTVPVWKNKKSDRITQFDKDDVEAVGLIKFDLLVINNLSIVMETIRLIEQRHGLCLSPWELPDGDTRTYELLHAGFVTGIFQMEASGAATRLIQEIQPRSIDELSDISALNRPGPQEAGLQDLYVEQRKAGTFPDQPTFMNEILASTHGIIVYQEQLMQVCSYLGDLTLREAEDVRRAMGKKKVEVLASYQERIVEKGVEKGLDRGYLEELWQQLQGFAAYAFNRSHACTYSYLTYACAYLKAHYPAEFFCALMSVRSRQDPSKVWGEKAPQYIAEARQLGVEILPPSINQSSIGFIIQEDRVWFGFSAIREVGEAAADSILKARGTQPFRDVIDFLQRVNLQRVNQKSFQALVEAGCWDRLGYDRGSLLENTSALYEYVRGQVEHESKRIEVEERLRERTRIDKLLIRRDELKRLLKREKRHPNLEEEEFLQSYEGVRRPVELKLKPPPEMPELVRDQQVRLQVEDLLRQGQRIGCYIGQHPAQVVGRASERLQGLWQGQQAQVTAIVTGAKEITTKKTQKKMAFLEIEDGTATAEVVVFSKLWGYVTDQVKSGALLHLQVKVEQEQPLKLVAERIELYRG